jgi:hypothetical protein
MITEILLIATAVVFVVHLIAGGIAYLEEQPDSTVSRWMWRIIDVTSPSIIILAMTDILWFILSRTV